MRISDWSSDVCSSDLKVFLAELAADDQAGAAAAHFEQVVEGDVAERFLGGEVAVACDRGLDRVHDVDRRGARIEDVVAAVVDRLRVERGDDVVGGVHIEAERVCSNYGPDGSGGDDRGPA